MDSLPPDKEAQEDRVVLALLSHLRENGQEAVLVERPDRLRDAERTFPEVTSDALLRLNGADRPSWWAADVMSLAGPASHHVVPTGLRERLTPVAEQYQVVIELDGDSPEPSALKALHRVVARAVSATPLVGSVEVEGLVVTWRRPERDEQPAVAIVALLLAAPSALLSDQVASELRKPLRKKATVQAARAHAASCRTAVLLDWSGHEGIAQGTHWLPRDPFTIKKAVVEVLQGVDHSLDAVLLFDRGQRWHLTFGSFPTF